MPSTAASVVSLDAYRRRVSAAQSPNPPPPKTVYHRPLSALAAEPEDSRDLHPSAADYRCSECGGAIWENAENHLFHTCGVEPLSLPWKESRRGNLYTTTTRFHCVVYPLGRAWGYRITDGGTDQGAYGRGRHPDQISAQLAAEEDLRHFECDPRAWG